MVPQSFGLLPLPPPVPFLSLNRLNEVTSNPALPSKPGGPLLTLCSGGLPSPVGKQTQKEVNTIQDEEVSFIPYETQRLELRAVREGFVEEVTFELVLEPE